MAEQHYLVGLNLHGRRVVVVGGGTVAQRRRPAAGGGGGGHHRDQPRGHGGRGHGAGGQADGAAAALRRRRPRRRLVRDGLHRRAGDQRGGGRRSRAQAGVLRAGRHRQARHGGHPGHRAARRSDAGRARGRAAPTVGGRAHARWWRHCKPVWSWTTRIRSPPASRWSAAAPATRGLITVRGRRLLARADWWWPTGSRHGAARRTRAARGSGGRGEDPLRPRDGAGGDNNALVEGGRRASSWSGSRAAIYVFGRGFEEVEACIAAGIPVTVVPGVTSASRCAGRRRASR